MHDVTVVLTDPTHVRDADARNVVTIKPTDVIASYHEGFGSIGNLDSVVCSGIGILGNVQAGNDVRIAGSSTTREGIITPIRVR